MSCKLLQKCVYSLIFLCPIVLTAQYIGNSPFCPEDGGIIINEISNGISGNASEEYIELLVVGNSSNPTASVDISGWIMDDNNAPNTGQGNARGHIRFGACYTALSAGDLLVVYNASDRNPKLPPDDPTDANGDGVYIIPHNSDCMIACNSNPFASNSNNADPNRIEYCPCQDENVVLPNWPAGMRNAGDVLQIRDRCETLIHAVHWGTVDEVAELANAPTRVHFDEGQSGKALLFQNGDWNNASNWENVDVENNESPGRANSVANASFITDIIAGVTCTGIVENCNEADAGDLLFPAGYSSTPIEICKGDDLLAFGHDYSQFDEFEPNAFDFQYAYLLTTLDAPDYTITDFNLTGDFDFTDATDSHYIVWGFSYLRTDGGANIMDFLTNEVQNIADIREYIDCGYFYDLDNLTQDGSLMEVYISEPPVVMPIELSFCENNSGQVALNFDAIIPQLGAEIDSVHWFLDAATTMRIDETEPFLTGDNLIYAQAFSGGCNSEAVSILIDVMPRPEVEVIDTTLCQEGFLEINGRIYDRDTPTGTQVLNGRSVAGCDSIININLTFAEPIVTEYSPLLCAGEEIRINGTAYNASNPTGEEILLGASQSGCDSTILINLRFEEAIVTSISQTLCANEILTINGTNYDINNPSGQEVLIASNACDSTLMIELNFYETAVFELSERLCKGESLVVNERLYDADNPNGVETLTGASSTGCDSTIIVALEFVEVAQGTYTATLCEDEQLEIEGTIFSADIPNATLILPNASVTGCDSLLEVRLTFEQQDTVLLERTLCTGEELIVNGSRYNESRPTGFEQISNPMGCDSLIEVRLAYIDELNASISSEIPTCHDSEDGVVNIESINGGTPPYMLFLGEQSQSMSDDIMQFDQLRAGTYTLEIEDANGCFGMQNIDIDSPEALFVELGEDFQVNSGDSIQLAATISDNVVDWTWTNTHFLSDSTSLSPFAQPFENTIFTLTVFDEAGCRLSDDLQISVSFERNVFIPTAFSPNEDGTNESLTIYTDAKALDIKRFQVYDRWGSLVFEQNNIPPNIPRFGWNGRINGELANAGLYAYFAEIEFSDGRTQVFSGEVMLVF